MTAAAKACTSRLVHCWLGRLAHIVSSVLDKLSYSPLACRDATSDGKGNVKQGSSPKRVQLNPEQPDKLPVGLHERGACQQRIHRRAGSFGRPETPPPAHQGQVHLDQLGRLFPTADTLMSGCGRTHHCTVCPLTMLITSGTCPLRCLQDEST